MPEHQINKEWFWSRVNICEDDKCWEWQGPTFNRGYGQFGFKKKTMRAHRVAWAITNGPIPEGKIICHHCDNKSCCNPNHLYCGTHSDNVCDREWRNPGTAGQPKLYEGEIWLIRRFNIRIKNAGMHPRYKFPVDFVAKMFKFSRSTIHRIWESDRWLCKEGYYV